MTNYYVRKAATGSNNGSDWTNAWNEMNQISWGSISPGDKIWVAGGTYTTNLDVQASGNADTEAGRIHINRARTDSSECTGASGWDAGYASLVIMSGANSYIGHCEGHSYWTVDGRTTANPSTHWPTGSYDNFYGWKVDHSTLLEGACFELFGTESYVTAQYIQFIGYGLPHLSTGVYRAFHLTNSGTRTNCLYSHIYIYGFSDGYYLGTGYNTIEYNEIEDIGDGPGGSYHVDITYVNSWNHDTLRYNKIHGGNPYGDQEGIFENSTGDTVYCYGNIFWGLNKVLSFHGGDNYNVINNTFVDSGYVIGIGPGESYTNSQTRNNIFVNATPDIYIGTESNNIVGTDESIFIDYNNDDFHIVSTIGSGYPRNAGMNAGSTYNTDMDDHTRGADGTWDIGAYEYEAGVGATLEVFKNRIVIV